MGRAQASTRAPGWARSTGAILCVLAMCLVPGALSAQYEPVLVTFLDVGQGDAVLVQAPEGQTALIDAGPPGTDLVPALRAMGVEQLDLVIATHPHADHIGGMLRVLRSMPVRFYMDNGDPYTTATYMSVLKELQLRPDITYLQAAPRTLQLGSVSIGVLPLPRFASSNPNERSVGLVLGYGAFSAFLSGDSEQPELLYWLQSGVVPDVTVLKAPHHGSDDSLSEAFLQVAQPEVVVISVGYDNTYGHPDPQALSTYERYGHELYRTDRDGSVTVQGFDDGSYRLGFGPPVGEPDGFDVDKASGAEPEARAPQPAEEPVAVRVVADVPGRGYAMVSNATSRAVDISGWMLCDADSHCFTFPTGASIAGGSWVILYAGPGRANARRFYMGSREPVWDSAGDTATLYDAAGAVVAQHEY